MGANPWTTMRNKPNLATKWRQKVRASVCTAPLSPHRSSVGLKPTVYCGLTPAATCYHRFTVRKCFTALSEGSE